MKGSMTLTIPELAVVLGISRNLAYALARDNRLPVPVLRLGRRLVVPRAAVEKLLLEGPSPDGDDEEESQ